MAANKDNRGSLDWIKSKAAEAQDKAKKRMAETPRQMFLPGMEELMRAMPNPVARSSNIGACSSTSSTRIFVCSCSMRPSRRWAGR
jgi:hypothetical protein